MANSALAVRLNLVSASLLISVLFLAWLPSSASAEPELLLKEWTGPYGGVPPFDKVKQSDFIAAFDAAISEAAAEMDAIAKNPDPATFENVFIAMERAERALERLDSIFGVHSGNLNLGDIPAIEKAVYPKLSAFSDSIYQNAALFARIETVYRAADKSLKPNETRLVEKTYKGFVRAGATLGPEKKKRISEINQELSKLETDFTQHILEDEKQVTWIETEAELAGLDASLIGGYKAAAESLNQPGKWAIKNTRSAVEPFLSYSDNRALREKVWRTFVSRGDNGDKNDNNAIISKLISLRHERAKILGYESHAHLKLEPQMAKTPQAAMDLMMGIWPKAVKRVGEEVADMQKIADAEGKGVTIEPWDYYYYAEKVRKAKYDLDSNEVRQYLQLDKMIEAMHWVAKESFGLTFTKVTDVPVFHEDVTVYKVTDKQGAFVGLWYMDPYEREGKQSGAWMTGYRGQHNMDGDRVRPLVSNNLNLVKGEPGKPVLIAWDDAVTLFHEFGHALHGLCSQVTYQSQSGTRVPRDFVEFPSQLVEHWLSTKEVLTKFALHADTGKPMPADLMAKIEKAATFNKGFDTVEFLSSAIVDMKLHLAGELADPRSVEKQMMKELGMPKEMVMRHRMPHFAHIFSNTYHAGYYSYLWADALVADAAELFNKNGYYDQTTCASLVANVLSVGDSVDAADSFRAFRGRDVDTKALLRKRGFPVN